MAQVIKWRHGVRRRRGRRAWAIDAGWHGATLGLAAPLQLYATPTHSLMSTIATNATNARMSTAITVDAPPSRRVPARSDQAPQQVVRVRPLRQRPAGPALFHVRVPQDLQRVRQGQDLRHRAVATRHADRSSAR